jgi:Protein of unknown function (DUF1501)
MPHGHTDHFAVELCGIDLGLWFCWTIFDLPFETDVTETAFSVDFKSGLEFHLTERANAQCEVLDCRNALLRLAAEIAAKEVAHWELWLERDRAVQVRQGAIVVLMIENCHRRAAKIGHEGFWIQLNGAVQVSPCAGRVAILVAQERAREIDHEIIGLKLDDLVVIGQSMDQVFFLEIRLGSSPVYPVYLPAYGAVIARELGDRKSMPPYVQLGNAIDKKFGGGATGFLGDQYNPFILPGDVSASNFTVRDVVLPGGVDRSRFQSRMKVLRAVDTWQKCVEAAAGAGPLQATGTFYEMAYNLVTAPMAKKTFDIYSEDPRLRDRYGRNSLGQGCLLARRLIEGGVRFVTVTDGGWDIHQDNFKSMGLSEACPGCERLRIPGHAALCPGHPAEKSRRYYSPIP